MFMLKYPRISAGVITFQEGVMNIVEALERADRENSQKDFLKYDGGKKTFSGLFSEVKKFAAGLKKLGVKKGDRVALLVNNSPEFIVAYFAAVYLGAEAVPLNTFLRLEEVLYILDDSKAKVFITTPDFNNILKDLTMNRAQALEHVIGIGEIGFEKYIKYGDVFENEGCDSADISDNDTAVIIYTSGTTGYPKGAMLSHKNLISNVESSVKAIQIKKSDRFIIFLPMFHAFSFTVCVLLPLYQQCNLTIIKSIQPFGKILKAIVKDRISVFVAIPQVYNVLAGKKFNKFLLKLFSLMNPIRVCISGAAPLAGEVLRKFEKRFGVPLMEGYGLSEASPVVSVNPLDGVRKAGSVGPVVPGVKAKVVDEEGNEIKDGSAGELVVSGPNIMKGYFNNEQETAEMLKDGWLYTGDIAKIDSGGYIYIVDRKKDLIIVNGMNLYPREVEEVLYTHPSVEDAAVVGKKDPSHGEIPVGVIKLREGEAVSEGELKKFLRPHFGNYKVPHKFEFWDELPRNGTGKILKREIRNIINREESGK